MGAKAQMFVPKGMRRDLSDSKADPQFAFENHNIRITPNNGSTLLSITNERGNEKVVFDPSGFNKLQVTATYKADTNSTLFEIRTERPTQYNVPVTIYTDKNTKIGSSLSAGRSYGTFQMDGVKLGVSRVEINDDFTRIGIDGIKYTTDELETRPITLPGKYVGHGILNEYLVLFLHMDKSEYSSVPIDYIVRLNESGGKWLTEVLFVGDIGLSPEAPIETLCIYENKDIQKVYWVDGLHQPRVINIVGDKSNLTESSLNFVGDYWPTTVEVTPNNSGSSNFGTGAIQYVVTYLNLYGSETHPVYISDLLYTAPAGRGGNAEERASTSFDLSITPGKGVPYKYARIYSVIRTSINSTPATKLVATIALNSNETTYRISDRNLSGSDIEPSELLYKGGDPIQPYTMSHKDGTLFLGNYDLVVRPIDAELKETIKYNTKIYFRSKLVDLALPTKGSYPYVNTLDRPSSEIKTFHSGECYRFGVQLLHKTGVWSEVIYVGDARVENVDSSTGESIPFNIEQLEDKVKLIKADISWPAYTLKDLYGDYIGARGVVVYPSLATREVVCQGILSPTVYSAQGRLSNRPFAQSSWFARPNLQYRTWDDRTVRGTSGEDIKYWDNSGSPNLSARPYWEKVYGKMTKAQLENSHLSTVLINKIPIKSLDLGEVSLTPPDGVIREFRHNRTLPHTSNRNAEIQYMDPTVYSSVLDCYIPEDTASYRGGGFFVDQSIVTLHSPELEFDDAISQIDTSKLKLRIVGYCSITGNQSDRSITAASPSTGKDTDNIFSVDCTSKAGMRITGASATWRGKGTLTGNRDWIVYPWHRSGSLDDNTTPETGKSWTSKLETKILSNLSVSSKTTYLPKIWKADSPYLPNGGTAGDIETSKKYHTGISGAVIYKDNGNPMIKIPAPKNYINSEDLLYYGEVDKIWYPDGDELALNPSEYGIYYIDSYGKGNVTKDGKPGKESILMKYKSRPHAVIALNYSEYSDQIILPTIYEIPDGIPSTTRVTGEAEPIIINNRSEPHITDKGRFPFWLRKAAEERPTTSFKRYTGSDKPNRVHLGYDTIWWEPTTPSEGRRLYTWQVTGGGWAGSIWQDGDSIYQETSLTVGNLYRDLTSSLLPNGELFIAVADKSSPTGLNLKSTTESDKGVSYGVYQDAIKLTTDYGFFWLGELYRDMPISERFGGTSEEALKGNHWLPCGPITLFEKTNYAKPIEVSFGTKADLLEAYESGIRSGYMYITGPDTPDNQYYQKIVALEDLLINTPKPWLLYSRVYLQVPMGKYYRWSDEYGMQEFLVNIECNEGDTYYQRYDCLKTYANGSDSTNSIVDIVSFLCETRLNIDGRYDKNRGNLSNLAASPENFNLFNPVYSQENSFFPSNYIESGRFELSKFQNSIVWTRTKSAGEEVDTWTQLSLLSSIDLDGDKGAVEALRRFNNEIYSFQPLGISRIFFNSHAQVLAQGEGSGTIPVELMNSGKVEGKAYLTTGVGSSNKWSIVTTPTGLYFIDNRTNSIQMFTQEGLSDLSDKLSFRTWVEGVNTMERWNPKNFDNIIAFYDSTNSDIYFVSKDENSTLVYSELIGQFTSFMSYNEVPLMFPLNGNFYSFKNNTLWQQNVGEYNSFFGDKKPYSVEVVCNMDSPVDKIFNNLEWRATIKEDGLDSTSTFDTLRVTTDGEYQDTGNVYFQNRTNSRQGGMLSENNPTLRRKFRIWRAPIPRDKVNKKDRIRGPWAKIRLTKEEPGNEKMELHDIVVHFFE